MNSKMNLIKPAICCFALFGATSVFAAQISGNSSPPPKGSSQTGAAGGKVQGADAASGPAEGTRPATRDGFDRGGKSDTSSRNGSAQNAPPTGDTSNKSTKPAKHKK